MKQNVATNPVNVGLLSAIRSNALTGFDCGLDPTVFEVEFPSVVNAVRMYLF